MSALHQTDLVLRICNRMRTFLGRLNIGKPVALARVCRKIQLRSWFGEMFQGIEA